MVYIGIDQSLSSSAYCIIEDDNMIEFGTIKTKKEDGDTFFRINQIVSNLKSIIIKFPNAKISIEGLSFGNSIGNSSRDLAGLQNVIINHFRYDLNIDDILIIAPTSVKKFATESGKAKKSEMVAALPEDVRAEFKKSFKVSTGLYDLADAYYIAKFNQSKNIW